MIEREIIDPRADIRLGEVIAALYSGSNGDGGYEGGRILRP